METVQLIDEMNDVQMMMWAWGDRAWWVIESIFLHSPDKGFWHVKLFSRANDFADFSVNSQLILMHYSKHYFPVMGRLPWKFYWKILYKS